MADYLPLLVFPKAKLTSPASLPGFPLKPHFPKHARQVERIAPQIKNIQQSFTAMVSDSVAGLEPEMVLVVEIAGTVDDFKKAIDNTSGLEWLAEWDLDDISADEDFYQPATIGANFFKNKIEGITEEEGIAIRQKLIESDFINRKGEITVGKELPDDLPYRDEINQLIQNKQQTSRLGSQLFLSYSNQKGLTELLSLWGKWQSREDPPKGQTKWRDIFNQAKDIRLWGIKETLIGTGMADRWNDLLNSISTNAEDVVFQIELFYQKESKRRQNEQDITRLLEDLGGSTINNFIDISDISFHAVKARLPAQQIETLLANINDTEIALFKFPGIMYFRPTGQNVSRASNDLGGKKFSFPELQPSQLKQEPVVAILDGVPNLKHEALKGRLIFEDPDNLSDTYQAGQRQHGTAMASLVIHGDLSGNMNTLPRYVYCLPVMESKSNSSENSPSVESESEEGFPDEIFFEDRIEKAVKRIFEGKGDVPAQSAIKIINISLGDPDRPFSHSPSPWARLLDYLSFKYRVLFCVSAGNYTDDIDINMASSEFSQLTNEKKQEHIVKCISQQLLQRRLLSPAESLNAITAGALNTDKSNGYPLNNRIDLLPDNLFSPISRFGYGFKRSIKPEIYFAGGKQLFYNKPSTGNKTIYSLSQSNREPGQQTASDSSEEGKLSQTIYTSGTSNAAALATHSSARIYEVLSELQAESNEYIPDNLMAVLIKTLLVHGAKQNDGMKSILKKVLQTEQNKEQPKKTIGRYLGYGAVDIERVLACTKQRGTILACDEIEGDEAHEYSLPLPPDLSSKRVWRRMTMTLAWFSPINCGHRNLREAKLFFGVPASDKPPLKIKRTDADHNQVKKGTVQHEILEGEKKISAYQDGESIKVKITCKKDATENLNSKIPYGLAVTLEVEEGVDISIYQQIKERIQPQVRV